MTKDRVPRTRWQGDVLAKVRSVEYERERLMGRLCAGRRLCAAHGPPKSVRESICATTSDLLYTVRRVSGAASPDGRRHPWQWLRPRLDGSAADLAFVNLHAAEVILVDLFTEDEIGATAPDVLARLRASLPASDPRVVRAQEQFGPAERPDVGGGAVAATPTPPKPACELCQPGVDPAAFAARRADFRRVAALSYEAADEIYSGIRNFRNVLLVAFVALTALLTLTYLVVRVSPGLIDLCVGTTPHRACPYTWNGTAAESPGRSTPRPRQC